MTEIRHKHGDVREDGMVFWCYAKTAKDGEWWVTPEKFAEMRKKHAARMRARYSNDPEYREKLRARERDRYANDPEFREKKATRERNPEYLEKKAARERGRYANNPEYREKKAARLRDRRANDPLFAASSRIRVRTRLAFNRLAADKPASTEGLLGTDWQTLKAHIESQFVDGMSWENMSEWHIDHIVPLASAKTEDELAELCHYTNLQPLWASDNLSKGAKLPHQLN